VYSDEAMYHLKASGYVVYLQCVLDVLDGRIASMSDRGIAAPSGQSLADVQAERIPLYEHFADLTVEVSHQDSEQALASILQQLPL
jgi:shikimate kinase